MLTHPTTPTLQAIPQRASGHWRGTPASLRPFHAHVATALQQVARPVYVVERENALWLAHDGWAALGASPEETSDAAYPLRGHVPALLPEQLGDSGFREAHGIRYAYVGGAMANGIASCEMVAALARCGYLAFFGAAGLSVDEIAGATDRLQAELGDLPFGMNLIHSPQDRRLEAETVELYLRRGVRLISAAAYLDVSLPLIRYRVSGLRRTPDGRIETSNRVIAKVSRVEVATRFFSPPPEAKVAELLRQGLITPEQAELAQHIPLADDLTAEADSGGHTDNRPALALLPTMLALRDRLAREHGYDRPLRVGAAGGIATPQSVAAAYSLGAAYVLTGTVNQACVEAGTSAAVRQMLAEAGQADVTMAPAADMFEMGVSVQVLKRGTMFSMRARKLYEWYRACAGPDALPSDIRNTLERDYFRCTLDEMWAQTCRYFETHDPAQIERAERDPKHKLALLCRAYLGQTSNWANAGIPDRRMDYQVWCGPAIGAFNEWVRGTFLEEPAERRVATVAENLMTGAAALSRANLLRMQGLPLPSEAERFEPRPRDELANLISTDEQMGAGLS